MTGPTMVVNIRYSSGAGDPGHVNYTFNDGNGNTFTVGATSRGSLSPNGPYASFRQNLGGSLGGIGANFSGTNDGVIIYESPANALDPGHNSVPISLDPQAFTAFMTFLNNGPDGPGGASGLTATNPIFIDYDLGVQGLGFPGANGQPNGWGTLQGWATVAATLFPQGAVLPGLVGSYYYNGRNGINCLELIFGNSRIGLPQLVNPDNFDFGSHLPLNALLGPGENRLHVGTYAIQHYSPNFVFSASRIQLPSVVFDASGKPYSPRFPSGWQDSVASIFTRMLDERWRSGNTVDEAFIQSVYNHIQSNLALVPGTFFTGGGSGDIAYISNIGAIENNVRRGLRPNSGDAFQYCFLAGTPILMADGTERPIEQVKAGDQVLAFDPASSGGRGPLSPQGVLRTFKSRKRNIVNVLGVMVTYEHPFLTEAGTFASVGDIGVQTRVVAGDGSLVSRGALECVPGEHDVYNFEVEAVNTYVAGGLRVHNLSYLAETSPGHWDVLHLDVPGYPNSRLHYDANTGHISAWVYDASNNAWINSNYFEGAVVQAIYANNGQFSAEAFGLNNGQIGPIDITQVMATAAFSRAVIFDDHLNSRIEFGGDIAYQFGSTLGRLLSDDPVGSLVLGIGLGTVARNLGEAIANGGFKVDWALWTDSNVFDDFFPELAGAAAGAISSLLVGELFDALGLEGELADLGASLANGYVARIAENLITANTGVFDGLDGVNPATIVASFVGARLAAELVQFDTIGGQIGASLGSSVGSIVGIKMGADGALLGMKLGGWAGPIGALIGAFLGYIFGGLIGSLFGGKPKSGASIGWNDSEQKFQVVNVWSKNGGSKDAVRSFATSVSELLNGVISATGSEVIDPTGVQTGAYDTKGKYYYYKTSASANYAFKTTDASKLITHGQFIAVSDLSTRLIGGNVFVKRAVLSTLAQSGGNPDNDNTFSAGSFDASALLGNTTVAQDYVRYLANEEVINALLGTAGETPLAAGWVVTLARAVELGLDKRASSDWNGGWNAFFDESADGALDGNAFSPANVVLDYNVASAERSFGFFSGAGDFLGAIEDTIEAKSKDRIVATASADTLIANVNTIALTTALTLNGAAATAGNRIIRVAALIDGAGGNDTIRGGDLGNDLVGGDGNDVLVGGKLDDWLIAGAGDDRLFASNAANVSFTLGDAAAENTALALDGGNGDYLEGGDGADALYGSRGSDWLNGGAGIDRILGGAGGDILQGGKGDEKGAAGEARILGGAGSDQYLFSFGDGKDVVFDESDPAGAVGGTDPFATRMAGILSGAIPKNWAGNGQYLENGDVKGGEDAVAFAPGITLRNIVMKRSGTPGAPGNDLIIQLANDVNGTLVLTGDEITVKDWFTITRRVEWLRFADGEEIRIGDITSFIVGTTGADVIIGTYGADFMVGDAGDDQLRGLAGNDFGFGGGGNDFVAGDSDNDLVAGGSGADEVIGGAGNDTVFGDDGADDLYGGAGNDILAGGLGDDQVVTGAGNDIVRFERGDGRDTVIDEHVNNWDVVWQNGVYLNGYTLQTNGTVTLAGVVVFDGKDWLGRYDWDDTNKKLSRHKGAVGGNVASNAGSDTIEFGLGVDIQDIILRRVGNDAVFAITTGEIDARLFADITDQITIKDWFTVGASIEQFVFTETGSIGIYTLTGGTDGADAMTLNAVANWATGGLGDDTIVGSTSVDILAGGLDGDILRGGAGADILLGGAGDDLLEGGAGGDQLIGGGGSDIASYAASTVSVFVNLTTRTSSTGDGLGDVISGVEGLEGSAFDDKLIGDTGANTLRGLGGADLLKGGAGDDIYELNLGAGADIISDGPFVLEQVVDAGGAFNSAEFAASWTRTSLTYANGFYTHKYLLVINKISTGEEVYRSRDGADFTYYNASSALLALPSALGWPASDGQWKQGFYRTGSGVQVSRDTIVTGDGGMDTLAFGVGISLSDLVITRPNSSDITITYSASDNVTLRQNWLERSVDTVHLSDGLEFNLTTNLKLVGDAGSAGDDAMFGDAAANSINGLAGNDVISGAAGNDILSGGAGDDAFEGGAGADSYDGGVDSNTDGLVATTGDWGDTIRYVRSGAGVIVNLSARTISGRDAAGAVASLGDGVGDTIVVSASGGSSIENVVGSEGYADTLTGDARANRLFGLGGSDILTGNDGDDVLVGDGGADTASGGLGADGIDGGDGSDTLNGGDGNDFINGGLGNDTLSGDAGDDQLVAGDGNDTLFGQNDNDELSGESGDDILNGGAGDDRIVGGLGADNISGGDGADVITGSEGADILQGGLGDDVYYVDAKTGADTLVDVSGANKLAISGVASNALWLVRIGTNLVITAIGVPGFQVTLSNYYGASNKTVVREVATSDASLFLSHADSEILINAMSAASANTPATMPQAIAATLSSHWDSGNRSAPRVNNQSLAMVKGGSLTGAVGATDHDEDARKHAPVGGANASYNATTHVWTWTTAAGNALTLNESSGTWTFQPASTYSGTDTFMVKVTDAAGNSAEQAVSVFVRDNTVNYAPDTPTIVTQPLLIVQEGAIGGLAVATLAATDPNGTTPTLRIASDPGNLFEIVGNQLRFKAGKTISYAALQNANVQIEAVDSVAGSGLVSASKLTVNVGVLETNHAPSLPNQTVSVVESTPGAGQVVVATLAPFDPDGSAVNRSFRYQTLEGDTSVFSVDEMTGEVRVQGLLDYETRQSYGLKVQVWDGGALGAGLASPIPTVANVTFNIANVNEAPSLALVSTTTGASGLVGRVGGVDPEGSVVTYYATTARAYYRAGRAVGDRPVVMQWIDESQPVLVSGFINVTTGNVYFVSMSLTPVTPGYYTIAAGSTYYLVDVVSRDPAGVQSLPIKLRIQSGAVLVAPIVLDLDGDGLELISLASSTIAFDMAGNGEAERTGWVGADDGLLVYDRNFNGMIDSGLEIAFSEDIDFAVSDLEGLRAYDSNEDGLFGAGDAQYANFAVWRDANQDGVSQVAEMNTLAQLGIDAISLTLSPTGESVAGATDNVIYGTTAYLRSDGSIGAVGDVYLAYVDWTTTVEAGAGGASDPGQLAPIVLDLDRDGVKLATSANSNVRFDANGDGFRQATGWFSAGDGVLALDRNGDGAITSGAEISFREDAPGAQSDLEGLAGYDSNENGMIDQGDAAYGDFLVWRDANQDGVSQRHELATLARHGIASVNLTRSNLVQPNADTRLNTVLATTNFIWRDGSIGEAADAVLGYEGDGASTPEAGGDRNSDSSGPRRPGGGGGGGGHDDRGEDFDAAEPVDMRERGRRRGKESLRPPGAASERQPSFDAIAPANDVGAPPLALAASGGALHAGLGVMDRKLLGMIDAMAQFEASSSADLGRGQRKLSPRVAELLTSLPDIR